MIPSPAVARRWSVSALLVVALGAGCDDEPTVAGADGRPAADATADAPAPIDGSPVFDMAPDAAPPDPAAPARIAGWPVRLVEGRPIAFELIRAAHAEGPVRVTVEGASMDPPTVELTAEEPRITVRFTAPLDADERPGRATVWLDADERWPIDVPVIDVHHTFELVMTAEQVESVRRERTREARYRVGTRVDGVAGPDAEINLRGKGTFFCARRSFTVRFDTPTRIGDSPPLEHLTLLSMCEDTPYLRMHSSAWVMREAGIFPHWFGYAELRYGEGTRGVYLMVERPRKVADRVAGDSDLIIRRLNDAEEEIKVPDEDSIADREAVLAPYRALYRLAEGLQGATLLDQLDRRMDYAAYLDWLAVNSVLENGDYRDEVYFYERTGPVGASAPYFGILPWDYDGVQTRCHVGDPIPEPLMYCAESGLDLPVMTDPVVQARYVERLLTLIDGPLAPARYAETVRRSADELAVYLDRDGVRAIMTRDGVAPDPPVDAPAMAERQAARVEALRGLLP